MGHLYRSSGHLWNRRDITLGFWVAFATQSDDEIREVTDRTYVEFNQKSMKSSTGTVQVTAATPGELIAVALNKDSAPIEYLRNGAAPLHPGNYGITIIWNRALQLPDHHATIGQSSVPNCGRSHDATAR